MLTPLNVRERFENELAGRDSPVLPDGTSIRSLIDFENREVSLRVLNDSALHELEMQRIFMRAWILVGHESEAPSVGDYVRRAIGEDHVIVTRTPEGEISILLNACSHRGMEICRSDRGNAARFQCPYHGWVFDTRGRLTGAPFEKDMYGDWDKKRYGLRKAQVTVRHGLIFGSFDANPPPLDEWLGEFGWYFDAMFGGVDMEVVVPPIPVTLQANWKTGAEQNAGDSYHAASLHRSLNEMGMMPGPADDPRSFGLIRHGISCKEGHSLICTETSYNVHKVVPKPDMFPVGWFNGGAMFPGINVGGFATRGGVGIQPGAPPPPDADMSKIIRSAMCGSQSPQGKGATVHWLMHLVDKTAPEQIKNGINAIHGNAMILTDDFESWPSMQRAARGPAARQETMKYNTLLGPNNPKDWPGPALVHEGFGRDDLQWHFWLRWYDLMTNVLAS